MLTTYVHNTMTVFMGIFVLLWPFVVLCLVYKTTTRALKWLAGRDSGGAPVDEKTHSVVLLEGNICAGKSTLCRNMTEFCQWKHVVEPLHNELLKEFSTNEAKSNAFTFQMVMHERRVHTLQLALQGYYKSSVVVLDRSLIGDYAFALWNYINGSISEREFDIYHDLLWHDPLPLLDAFIGHRSPGMNRPQIVFMVQAAHTCTDRLRARPGVDSGMSEQYMLGVSIAHYICMLRLVKDKQMWPLFDVHMIGFVPNANQKECIKFADSIIKNKHFCDLHKSPRTLRDAGTLKLDDAACRRLADVCKKFNMPDFIDGEQCVSEAAWHTALYDSMVDKSGR